MIKTGSTRGNYNKPIVGVGFNFDLSRSIRAKRVKLKLTIEECCARTGNVIGKGMWSMYEHGTEPKVWAMCAIMRALGVSLNPWTKLLNSIMGVHWRDNGSEAPEDE